MPEGIGTDPAAGQATGDGRGELPAPVVSGGRNRDWIGIAANAGSGRGLGRDKVRRLVRELRRADLRVRIAWTPDERGQLVAESPRRPPLPVPGGGRAATARSAPWSTSARACRSPCCPPAPRTSSPATSGSAATRSGWPRPSSPAGPSRIDLGLAPARRFTLMAGFGFDADVVTRHHLARVRRTGVPRPTHRGDVRRAGAPVELRLPVPADHGDRSPTPAARKRSSARPSSSSTSRATPWGSRSPRRPAATTACSTWSSSATPARSGRLHYLWLVAPRPAPETPGRRAPPGGAGWSSRRPSRSPSSSTATPAASSTAATSPGRPKCSPGRSRSWCPPRSPARRRFGSPAGRFAKIARLRGWTGRGGFRTGIDKGQKTEGKGKRRKTVRSPTFPLCPFPFSLCPFPCALRIRPSSQS